MDRIVKNPNSPHARVAVTFQCAKSFRSQIEQAAKEAGVGRADWIRNILLAELMNQASKGGE